MIPEFWHQRWERNEIGFHQQEINPHLTAFWGLLRLPRGSEVFVPLAGKSRDMLWLAGEGHRVLGVEISPLAVRAFFEENRLAPVVTDRPPFQSWALDEVELLCGDFFDLEADRMARVAAVYDRASLVALPPEMRARYAERIKRLLPHDARILLVTLDYPQEQMAGPPFAVTPDEVHALYADRYRIDELFSQDVLANEPRFREKGLTRFDERVFLLTPR